MRAVNLIPGDQRKVRTGGGVGPQGGVLGYVVVGALALFVAAGAMYALTANKISDKETEVAGLEADEAAARARAEALSSFSSFQARQQAREVTVNSLAESRFDWERVMRELALVIPSDVWLVSLEGSITDATSGTTSENGIVGPSLEIEGCALGHPGVAEFTQALEDIDGVTRVGVNSSERPSGEEGAASGESDEECRTRDFISKFQITVAFDQVAVEGATEVPGVPPAAQPPLAQTAEAAQASTGQNDTGVSTGAVR